jgi:hypothetical protein
LTQRRSRLEITLAINVKRYYLAAVALQKNNF